MSDTPDLSKIISLIMENPDLISKIQGLAKGNAAADNTATPEKAEAPDNSEKTVETASIVRAPYDGKEKRRALLSAMKPYLSNDRSKAIDSMMSVAEILDLMKSR